MEATPKKTLYYVTGNPSKFKLFAQFVPTHAAIELKQYPMHLTEEQIEDQQAIALAKAKQAWQAIKQPLIVDEVGVYFHKYNNFPGAFTKFVYKGLGFDGIYKLMDDGDAMSIELIVVLANGESDFKIFTTKVAGVFKKPLIQNHDTHAPFDMVFVPQGCDKSYLELEQFPDIYEKVYFRSIAMKNILQNITEYNCEELS